MFKINAFIIISSMLSQQPTAYRQLQRNSTLELVACLPARSQHDQITYAIQNMRTALAASCSPHQVHKRLALVQVICQKLQKRLIHFPNLVSYSHHAVKGN